jgi:hypothetical protein
LIGLARNLKVPLSAVNAQSQKSANSSEIGDLAVRTGSQGTDDFCRRGLQIGQVARGERLNREGRSQVAHF